MKITREHRQKLSYYLKQFYQKYNKENYTVFHFVKFFKARLKENKDAWIGVSGSTGLGKSLFCLISMILFGRPMDMEKNVAYVPKGNEIVQKLDKLKFQTLLVDEAAKNLRAVQWQDKGQQAVSTTSMTDRFKNNLVFLNMPSFNEFTKSLRRGSIQFRAIIPYRNNLFARVIIQRKSRNWRSEDPWSDDLANKKYERVQKRYGELSDDMILGIERSLPNTVMDFVIPNLEIILPDVTAEYERLKTESRIEKAEEDIKASTSHWKEKYQELMVKVSKLLYYNKLGIGKIRVKKQEFAEGLGISPGTFDKYLKQKPKKKVEKRK